MRETPVPAPFARLLAAADARGFAARLGELLPAAGAALLLDAAAIRILALELTNADRASALAVALQRHGAAAQVNGTTLVAALTRAVIEAAIADQPPFAAELDALRVTLNHALEPPRTFRMRERVLDFGGRAHVMGILNVTPDSFYERVSGVDAAVERARSIREAGAALIDIGGQSYAHWNPRIAAEEERARVVPVVAGIAAANIDVALSIDTFKASVADAALAAGAHVINDCSGLSDSALPDVVAKHDAALVVLHLKGELNVRAPGGYAYGDALREIAEFLYERTERARAAGVARDSIAIDPGLEFGKEPDTDLEILERFEELTALGYPILFASSRKSFIGRLFDRPAKELLVPSLATAAIGIAAGARMLRVHDVAETVQLARMFEAVTPAGRAAAGWADRMPGTPQSAGNSRPARAV